MSQPQSSERTLILVKPDGVARGLVGEIIGRIEAKGYRVADLKMMSADRALLTRHYGEHEGKPSRVEENGTTTCSNLPPSCSNSA